MPSPLYQTDIVIVGAAFAGIAVAMPLAASVTNVTPIDRSIIRLFVSLIPSLQEPENA
jgi:NADH dehydrogenase FAD-containing subunit